MDSDDDLTLSAHALAALQDFKKEEQSRIQKFEELFVKSEKKFEQDEPIPIEEFKEDWQLSQFWFSDSTAKTLGKALLEGADVDTVIAIVSAPSVFAAIKSFPPEEVPTPHIYLLEYDKRFEVLAGLKKYFFYDYNYPENIPEELKHKCHRVLIDPPFLQERCQTNSAISARNLLMKGDLGKTASGDDKFKLISPTGERMRDIIKKNYPETTITDFYPQHKGGLSNEYRCYASFECEHWKFEE